MNPTQEPPLTVLFGLPFHDLTLEETLEWCRQAMREDTPRYAVTANVDFTAQAYEDADLKKIVFFADRVVCDGMPLVWLSRLHGRPLRERVAGSDMVPRLLDICAREGHGVYFFGSDPETLATAADIARERYPGLKICGMDSPPMGAVIDWDNDALCRNMRASGARLLLACLGCPKQERWIYAYHREAGIPLSIGVGASLDFIAGKQTRAPRWMQRTGLEWLWRMAGNPSRLASRYGKDFVFLARAALEQGWSQRRRQSLAPAPRPAAAESPVAVASLRWTGEIQSSDLSGAPLPATEGEPVLLDASGVTFLDSAGLGRLAGLVRKCRSAGMPLVVVAPSPAFLGPVTGAKMDDLFPIAADQAGALALLKRGAAASPPAGLSDGLCWVSFEGSLDALQNEQMVGVLEANIERMSGDSTLVVDLRKVDFIDSRAVGGLVRAWKKVAARGGKMYLHGARDGVREILFMLRLDKMLPEWKGDVPS